MNANSARIALCLFLLSAVVCAAQVKTLLDASGGLRNPYGVCVGPDRALYICDIDNHVIHRLLEGKSERFIGSGTKGYSGDGGPPKMAQLNEPYEVRFDREGNIYWVEMRNHLVRRLSVRDQIVNTVAGTGTSGFSGDDGPATRAQLNQPHSIQLDARGNIYICDIGNHRIRKVEASSGIIRIKLLILFQ